MIDIFVSQVVSKLLSLFSDEDYSQLMEWIYKFSRNTKISYRVFALDLLSELLTVPKRTPAEGRYCGVCAVLYHNIIMIHFVYLPPLVLKARHLS